MDYKILQALLEFEGSELSRVTVLVEISEGDIRAIFATNHPRNGYLHIFPGEKVSNELLQSVAAYGCSCTVDCPKLFPNYKRFLKRTKKKQGGGQ